MLNLFQYLGFCKTKKSAMFGLDARIALAIFGALSVITGAALFNAIKTANTEQWRQHFENIIKATEAYYLDNGQPLGICNTVNGYLYSGDLFFNRENLNTWKGPYIEYSTLTEPSWREYSWKDSMSIKFNIDAYFGIFLQKKSDWTSNINLTSEVCVTNSQDCVEWITLHATHTVDMYRLQKLFSQLDDLIDRGDGVLKGKVRYNTRGNHYLMYQGIPHIKRK